MKNNYINNSVWKPKRKLLNLDEGNSYAQVAGSKSQSQLGESLGHVEVKPKESPHEMYSKVVNMLHQNL